MVTGRSKCHGLSRVGHGSVHGLNVKKGPFLLICHGVTGRRGVWDGRARRGLQIARSGMPAWSKSELGPITRLRSEASATQATTRPTTSTIRGEQGTCSTPLIHLFRTPSWIGLGFFGIGANLLIMSHINLRKFFAGSPFFRGRLAFPVPVTDPRQIRTKA
jgi:hypothetical protein